ncbi:hypothetical protein ACH41E_21960 [Streptomyces sp. NPDC020412]|uniref:hypothetical protein n=1 Tax=Streptomyces sp. NPDC020412 TaxID=3365073 RepID=UPI00379723A3
MSQYRIQYAGEAEKVYRGMDPRFRARFDAEMAKTLARDPYGHGSAPASPGQEPTRRLATVAGAIVRYYISGPPLLVVTAVQIVQI